MKYEASPGLNGQGLIASFPLFQGMEGDVLQELVASARRGQYEKGEVLLARGAPIDRYYVLLEGWCGTSKGAREGQETILQIFRRGDFVPHPGKCLENRTSSVDLQALTGVRALILSPRTVQKALDSSRPFVNNMLEMSLRRTIELRERIYQSNTHGAEKRVGRFLLQLQLNRDNRECEIRLPFDKSFIAAYLGMNPATVSHILKGFKEKGFVIERNRVHLPTSQALCGYCNSFTSRSCRLAHTVECLRQTRYDK